MILSALCRRMKRKRMMMPEHFSLISRQEEEVIRDPSRGEEQGIFRRMKSRRDGERRQREERERRALVLKLFFSQNVEV